MSDLSAAMGDWVDHVFTGPLDRPIHVTLNTGAPTEESEMPKGLFGTEVSVVQPGDALKARQLRRAAALVVAKDVIPKEIQHTDSLVSVAEYILDGPGAYHVVSIAAVVRDRTQPEVD